MKTSDGTVIFIGDNKFTDGSAKTAVFCRQHGKPYLLIANIIDGDIDKLSDRVVDFIKKYNIKTLNVAGNRESRTPGIQHMVERIIDEAVMITTKPMNRGVKV